MVIIDPSDFPDANFDPTVQCPNGNWQVTLDGASTEAAKFYLVDTDTGELTDTLYFSCVTIFGAPSELRCTETAEPVPSPFPPAPPAG